MTNTMSLGRVLDSSMKWMIGRYPKLSDRSGAPNIIVTECNDGVINDMRGLHVKEENLKNLGIFFLIFINFFKIYGCECYNKLKG
ncbi:L-aminopeptidase/D-esterase [Peptoniphilus harei]|nr:L-aminopeptidase/D-esterase [Peptoniphilus harei]